MLTPRVRNNPDQLVQEGNVALQQLYMGNILSALRLCVRKSAEHVADEYVETALFLLP